jgi:hypothetical protein
VQTTMRGIVLLESLAGGQLPMPLHATVCKKYKHMLGGTVPVQVAELVVSRDRAPAVALQLARCLLPQRFYAHLLDDSQMYVAFPDTVVLICRDDPDSVIHAQKIGQGFDIPLVQMRFDEMFDNDHPDSPAGGNAWEKP